MSTISVGKYIKLKTHAERLEAALVRLRDASRCLVEHTQSMEKLQSLNYAVSYAIQASEKVLPPLGLSTTMKVEAKVPEFPFMFVWNDESACTVCALAKDAKARFKIGPHQDGTANEIGFYVHGEDLPQLRHLLRTRGMVTEAEWCTGARHRWRKEEEQRR